MFYGNTLRAMREEDEALSSQDQMFDGKETEEVAEELSDAMESIPEDGVEETTNGGIPFTAEMCSLVKCESANIYGRRKARYLVEMSILQHYMESEGVDDVEDAVENVAAANCGTDEDGNDVEITKADIVVVAPSDEEVKEIVDDAVQEAKMMKGKKKKGPARKKMDKLKDTIDELKTKGIKVAKKKSKK